MSGIQICLVFEWPLFKLYLLIKCSVTKWKALLTIYLSKKDASRFRQRSNQLQQTLTNRGPNSRFVLETIFKPQIPKLSRSSIMITINRVHTNHKYPSFHTWQLFIIIGHPVTNWATVFTIPITRHAECPAHSSKLSITFFTKTPNRKDHFTA